MKIKILLPLIILTATVIFTQPSSPVLIKPPVLSNSVVQPVELDWTDVSGALYYDIEISPESDFSVILPVVLTQPTTSTYTISEGALQPNTTYYWRVNVTTSEGTSDWSTVFVFTTFSTTPDEIEELGAKVDEYEALNKLSSSQANFLNNRLEDALSRFNNNQLLVARIHMYVFKLRVAALVVSNQLSTQDASVLQNHASDIISSMQGDNLSSMNEEGMILSQFSLTQNYPNPFNPTTTIEYIIPVKSFVTLKIYDIKGSEVATLVNEEQDNGLYIVNWDAKNYSSGVYFYKLHAGQFTQTKRMLLTK